MGKITYGNLQEIASNEAKKGGIVPFQGMLIQERIKALEEESRELLQDVIRCEVRFARQDLEAGILLSVIIIKIKERYNQRFHKSIIEALKKELMR